MSWSMYVSIYVKNNNVWSSTDVVDKDFDILKSLCEYRGSLSNDIAPVMLDSADVDSLEQLRNEQQSDEFEVSGYYYDSSSFLTLRGLLTQKFKELIIRKSKFDELKQNLEYLKLSTEEKQNVLDEEDTIIETLTDVEAKVDALTSIIAVLELFAEYDSSAVAFIYSA